MKRRLFGLVSAVVLAATSVPCMAVFADDDQVMDTTADGYDYEAWNQNFKGTWKMNPGTDGCYTCSWSGIFNFLARMGKSMEEIKAVIVRDYYPLDFTLDEIRPTYHMDESCQGAVPQALEAFFESTSFEDAVRNAISIGGDSDTIGAICGAVAGAYYGVPEGIRLKAETFLNRNSSLLSVRELLQNSS